MGQDVLNRVTKLLSPENLDAISGSAEGLNTLIAEVSDLLESEGNLSEALESFNRAASGLADITADGAELGDDLASTMAKADSLMDHLNTSSESVSAAVASLQTILTRIENGEGTLGQLWASDSLYESLTATAESARLLLDDLREHPERYMPKVSVF